MPGRVEDREEHPGPEGVLQPAPLVDEAEAGPGGHVLAQLEGRCTACPSRRGPSRAGSGARPRRRSRGCAGSRGPGRRRAPVSSRWWYHSTACSMASRKTLRLLVVLAGVAVLADGDAGPVGQAAHGVDEVEVLDLPHEADGVARWPGSRSSSRSPSSALTLNDGVFSCGTGTGPTQRWPCRFSAACSPIRATMSVAARTRATSSSGMPTATTVPRPGRTPSGRPRRRRRAAGRAAAQRGRRPSWPAAFLAGAFLAGALAAAGAGHLVPGGGVPGQDGLGGGQAGDRHPERRAAHVVEAGRRRRWRSTRGRRRARRTRRP